MTYLKKLFENCYLKIVFSFSSLTLHAVNFFALKENEFCSWGDQDVTLNKGTGGGGSPCKPKSLNIPFCWIEIS